MDYEKVTVDDEITDSVLIRNDSQTEITINELYLKKSFHFKINNKPELPYSIPVSGEYYLNISFNPKFFSESALNDSVKIKTSEADAKITLKGKPVSGNIAVSPSKLEFDSVQVDQEKIMEFTLTNIGEARVRIEEINVTTLNQYKVLSFEKKYLQTDSSFRFLVQFVPDSNLVYTDSVLVNVSNAAEFVKLTGFGKYKVGISEESLPKVYALEQNYPNPFNNSTTILYQLPEQSDITISLYNIKGELVKAVMRNNLQPGYYREVLDFSGYGTGVYFYMLQVSDRFTKTRKLMLIK